MEVRNARPEEVETLAEIGLAAWQKGIAPHMLRSVVEKIVAENPFLPFLCQMGPAVLVAVDNGNAAGIGASEHCDDCISDIWVAPAFEGRGAASALIRALEGEILRRGHGQARIDVAAANERALRLYEHLGYGQMWRRAVQDPILGIALEKIGLYRRLNAT